MMHALYIFSNNNYNCLSVRIKTKSYLVIIIKLEITFI